MTDRADPSFNRKPQACALSSAASRLTQNARACGVRLNDTQACALSL